MESTAQGKSGKVTMTAFLLTLKLVPDIMEVA